MFGIAAARLPLLHELALENTSHGLGAPLLMKLLELPELTRLSLHGSARHWCRM